MVDQATGQRASLDAQISAARARELQAKQDLARMEELAGKAIVSKQQLDAAHAAANTAAANVVALERQTIGGDRRDRERGGRRALGDGASAGCTGGARQRARSS